MANILVVDDDPKARELLAAVLGYLGYGGHQLRETADGAEALMAIQSHKPDLVIADLLMPTMDGFEFVRQLRQQPEFARTPVVFYTASYLESESQHLAHACGVKHIIRKPAEPEQILQIVSSVLGANTSQVQLPPVEEFRQEQLRLLTSTLMRITSGELPRMQTLVDLLCRLVKFRKTQKLLQVACSATRMLVSARHAIVAMHGTTPGKLQYHNATGMQEAIAESLNNPQEEYNLLEKIHLHDQAVRLDNLSGSPASVGLPPEHPQVNSFLVVPIATMTRTHGWLCLSNCIGSRSFSENDQMLASIVCSHTGHLLELLQNFQTTDSHAMPMHR